MGYRRLDINLLPPELQPGPVVRYAVVINTILIGVTVAFLAVDAFLGVTRVAALRRDIDAKQDLIREKADVVQDYNDLLAIENHVDSVGRLISLASAEYVDMPVIMDRIARIVPDGVHVASVSTQRRAVGSLLTTLRIEMMTAAEDPALLISTFRAFKEDPILGNCFMRVAEYEDKDISAILDAAGITWQASGPDIPDFASASGYKFEINTDIVPPVDAGSVATELDKTHFFEGFDVTANAAVAMDRSDTSNGAPQGVTVVESN